MEWPFLDVATVFGAGLGFNHTPCLLGFSRQFLFLSFNQVAVQNKD